MLRGFFQALVATSLLAGLTVADISDLCAQPSWVLQQAAQQYPNEAFAINKVLQTPIPTWYVDYSRTDTPKIPGNVVSYCGQDKRVFIVVYGLPNKDCEAGYSNQGYNKNTEDYRKFIQDLVDAVGQRKALFILEPDAVGLAANGGCAIQNQYIERIQMALGMLSANPNAEIYLDVGYWTLLNPESALRIANVVKEFQKGGRIKGISLNSSNYRPSREIAGYCTNFQQAYGNDTMHCIVDTGRNGNENPPSTEWCNSRFGGIGHPPTAQTGYPNLDYFVWIKTPGESDGTCDGSDRSADSMKGPAAGVFFNDHFVKLWDQGYFVQKMGMPMINGTTVRPATTRPVTTPIVTTTRPVTTRPVTTRPATTRPATTRPVTTPTPTTTPTTGTAQKWGQCGGIGWSGPTRCVSGTTCTKLNDWYYQCL